MELYVGGILNLPNEYYCKYLSQKEGYRDVEQLLVDITDDTKKQIREGLYASFESLYDSKEESWWKPPTLEDLYLMIQEL